MSERESRNVVAGFESLKRYFALGARFRSHVCRKIEVLEVAQVLQCRSSGHTNLPVNNFDGARKYFPALERLSIEKRDPRLLGGVDYGSQQADENKEGGDDTMGSHGRDLSRGVGGRRDFAILACAGSGVKSEAQISRHTGQDQVVNSMPIFGERG